MFIYRVARKNAPTFVLNERKVDRNFVKKK